MRVGRLFGNGGCARMRNAALRYCIIRTGDFLACLFLVATAPPLRGRECRWCGRGRAPLRGGVRGVCLNAAAYHQDGGMLLHYAARGGHAAMVGQLLAAEAKKETTDNVRGGGGVEGRG